MVKTSLAQDGLSVDIGASHFASINIESVNPNTYLEVHNFIPAPLIEVGYIHSLNDKQLNISARFKASMYNQGYTFQVVHNDTVGWLKILNTISLANFDFQIYLEKGVVSGKNSTLYGCFGIGLEAMLVPLERVEIPTNEDTLKTYSYSGNNEMHYSPAISAGLKYRVENNRHNFWQFGIEYTQTFSNLGTLNYVYGEMDNIDSGKFFLRGSNISFKVGYLFAFKKSKPTQPNVSSQ